MVRALPFFRGNRKRDGQECSEETREHAGRSGPPHMRLICWIHRMNPPEGDEEQMNEETFQRKLSELIAEIATMI